MISLYFWVDYVDILFGFILKRVHIYRTFDDSTVIKIHKIRNNY